MCGRYTYYSSSEILKQFDLKPDNDLKLALELPDNYNVSPGNHMPVIIRGEQEHVLEFMVWGLVPAWAKSPDESMKLINARAEGLLEKPMWKRLVKSKRCVVPARGFYEWKTENGKKQPYHITPKNGEVFSFAGLWDEWHDSEGVEIQSYSIITTAPNREMKNIHTRMPAILNQQQMDMWLEPRDLDKAQLDDLLRPAPDRSLNIVRVSTEVNNARHNSKKLIYPLEENEYNS
jgi:putative SOS response-associated peptidase YedK